MDLIGKRYGRLVVIDKSPNPYITKSGTKDPIWICRCDCGNTVNARQSKLRKSELLSCGCLRKEMLKKFARQNYAMARELYK